MTYIVFSPNTAERRQKVLEGESRGGTSFKRFPLWPPEAPKNASKLIAWQGPFLFTIPPRLGDVFCAGFDGFGVGGDEFVVARGDHVFEGVR